MPGTTRTLAPRLLFALAACLMACAPAAADTADIRIVETDDMRIYQFQPRDVAINVGDVVRWIDDAPADHTVTSSAHRPPRSSDDTDGKFRHAFTGAAGETYSVTFDAAGAFHYFCEPHYQWMYGTVTVQAPTTTTTTEPAGLPKGSGDAAAGTTGADDEATPALAWVAVGGVLLVLAGRRRA